MSESQVESNKSDILPYDFVKENEVIVSRTDNGYVATSPKELSIILYQEIRRYLDSSFKFELCDSEKFNEILTNSFASSHHNNDISEEL